MARVTTRTKLLVAGSIVLHDGGGRGRRTLATLERVLPELRRRGLEVVTLSELRTSH